MKAIIGLFALLFLVILGTTTFLHGKGVTFLPKTKTVQVNQKVFTVDVVTSQKDQEKGLSGRNNLASDHGMLFVFNPPTRVSFWMKDMHFPLDLIFITNGKIVNIFQNVPFPKPNTPDTSLPVYTPDSAIDHVLEINAGSAKKYNIKIDDSVSYSL